MNARFQFPTERVQRAAPNNDFTWYAVPSLEVAGSLVEVIRSIEGASSPGRVYSFNAAEGWCRDVTEDVAIGIARAYGHEGFSVPFDLRNWLHTHLGCNTADEILGSDGSDD